MKPAAPVPPHERGAALLAVLVLVAIMGALSAAAFDKLRLSTALAVNGSALDQARAYAVGVETLLALRVDDLNAESPEATTLDGDWNRKVRRIPLPGEGDAEGAISDAGNCFNLNGLVEGAPGTPLRPRAAAIDQFAALMRLLGAGEVPARRAAEAAADWIDTDAEALPAGGEDAAYAGGERPYRTGNTLFADPSELRAVLGVTSDLYARLRPFVCALPDTEPTALNVNTLLPDQAPLLAMLGLGKVAPAAAQALIARRPAAGWHELAPFWEAAERAGFPRAADPLGQIQLRSQWFGLDLLVRYKGAEMNETALVDARFTPARIVARRWGGGE